jgi:glycine betaine/choline ABC-type transport system substrate-binding protein
MARRLKGAQAQRLKGVVIATALSLCACAPLSLLSACAKSDPIVVGSKNFTESVLLGELIAQRLERAGCTVERKLDLGGTLVCDKAITSGALDVYPEYSGTALHAILGGKGNLTSEYAKRGLTWGPPLGFENTFAMIVRKADAERHGLRRISDLSTVAKSFRPGFGYEFVERPDGWTGLQRHYNLAFAQPPRTMDLGLTYRALAAGQIDLIAGNSTDGLIDSLGLVVLEDDRRFFPDYDAAVVARADIAKKCAAAPKALASFRDALDEAAMRKLNYAVDGEKKSPADVVRHLR